MDLLSKMIAVTDRHMFDTAPDPEEAFLAQLARIFRAEPRAVVLRERTCPRKPIWLSLRRYLP